VINPFMTFAHCRRFAKRAAAIEDCVYNVIATGVQQAPLTVLRSDALFELGDVLGPHDILYTADPFMLEERSRGLTAPR